MHDIPRQLTDRPLTVDDLELLFEGRTRFVDRLAREMTKDAVSVRADPFALARSLLPALPEDEQLEALNAHPVIGAPVEQLSSMSAREQGKTESGEIHAGLARLNRAYEDKFGFRFVVFVNGRPKAEILEVLKARIERTRSEELATAMAELVSIAQDRFIRRGA